MIKYNPLKKPDRPEWEALDEAERILAVEDFHKRARAEISDLYLHAMIHTIVENQIVMAEDLPVGATLQRLMAGGMDRHEAVHAIGAVLSGYLFAIAQGTADDNANEQYFEELRLLTVESFRKEFETPAPAKTKPADPA